MKTYRITTNTVLGFTTVELHCRQNGVERRIACKRVPTADYPALVASWRLAAKAQGFVAE